jgi:hypothetical protein
MGGFCADDFFVGKISAGASAEIIAMGVSVANPHPAAS